MELSSLAWLITQCVLCRKSTDLSWEGEETDAAAVEKNPLAAVEESTPHPQAETMAPRAEATPPKDTIVEGMYSSTTSFALGNHSPRVLTPHILQ
jgi:hypothetical protein